MMFKKIFLMVCTLGVFCTGSSVAPASTITKCKDADGKWHYGDFAADACDRSRIEKINQKGQSLGEVAVPLTEDEIQTRKEAENQARERRQKETKQRAEDNRLLLIYDSSDAITKARDTRLSAVDSMIRSNDEFLIQLGKRKLSVQKTIKKAAAKEKTKQQKKLAGIEAQITDYEQSNEGLIDIRNAVANKYNTDLSRYLKITEGK